VTNQPLSTEFGFSDAEWGLLVGLPQAVLNAASAAESDGTRRTMAENTAGLETIAAGRESASPLVAAVAGELVSRIGDPEAGEELPRIEPAVPEALLTDVLDRAGAAARLLAAKVDKGEAGAYKHWLLSIAEQVVSAASSGGMLGLGGEVVTDSERKFRDALSHMLND
jgi:alkyl sulfatase BDS1-like metallo-beta-lactamase superfamily hydrolase